MGRKKIQQDELDLDALRREEEELRKLECSLADLPKRLALEIREKATMMPPHPDIEDRRRFRRHEEAVIRREVTNLARAQNRSLGLLLLLLAAACSLIWWCVRLMQG
jgi:hypothetical protein